MTRLRFLLVDNALVNMEQLKSIKGVMGCVQAGGQCQVIMGDNLIPAYEAIVKSYRFKEAPAAEDPEDPEDFAPSQRLNPLRLLKIFIEYVSAAVNPMIPGLIAGGMIKVALLLATKVAPELVASSTYVMLSVLGDAPFYFMPIMVAYGASKKLNANPIYAMLVAAAMISPTFLTRVADGVATDIFGVPVHLQAYTGQMFPSLMIAWVAAKLEKGLTKIIPGMLRAVLVGCLTTVITFTLTMIALAPLGAFAGQAIIGAFTKLYGFAGPLWLACSPAFFRSWSWQACIRLSVRS